MASPVQRRMSSMGLTTLVTETEENRSIANGCVEVDDAMSLAEVQSLLSDPVKGFAKNYRFRSKVVDGKFVEIPNFKVESLITEFTIPGPTDKHSEWILRHIGENGSVELDRDLPQWQVRVAQGYKGDKTLIYWRFHHCMIDGMAFMALLLGLSDEAGKMMPAAKKPLAKKTLPQKATALFLSIYTILMFFIGCMFVLLKHFKILIHGKKPSRSLKGTLGTNKSLAQVEKSIPLKEVKDAGKRLGNFTINDVMLAAFTGAIRRYLEEKDGKAVVSPGTTLTCALPKDLRSAGEEYIGNKFGAFTVELPLGMPDQSTRLKETARVCSLAKSSPEAQLAFYMGKLAYFLPNWLAVKVMSTATSNVECVFSNVPGPPVALHFKGHPLGAMLGFIPPPPGVGLGGVVFSGNGELNFSISADQTLMGDVASKIVRLWEEELQVLCRVGS